MNILSIQIKGPIFNLYIGEITISQEIKLLEYCPKKFGFSTKRYLNKLWYNNSQIFKEIIGVDDYKMVCFKDHNLYGPVLKKKRKLVEFFSQMKIFINEGEAEIDPWNIKREFLSAERFSRVNSDRLIIYHGESYEGYVLYQLKISEKINLDKLVAHFYYCRSNGYLLAKIKYNDLDMDSRINGSIKDFIPLNIYYMDPTILSIL